MTGISRTKEGQGRGGGERKGEGGDSKREEQRMQRESSVQKTCSKQHHTIVIMGGNGYIIQKNLQFSCVRYNIICIDINIIYTHT